MHSPHSQTMALVKVLLGAFLISFSSIMVKLAQVGPTASGFYRLFFGAICLFLVALLLKKPLWSNKKAMSASYLAGFLFCCDMALWHQSIHYIGPGLATLLANFQVFLVAFAGIIFLKERFSAKLAFSIPLGIAGLYMIIAKNIGTMGHNYTFGVILGLLAALAYTLYLFALRYSTMLKNHLPTISNMAHVSLSGAFFIFFITLANGESLVIPKAVDWLWLLIYGILCHSLGWILIATAMPLVPASKLGLILLLQPALAFVWDILLFDRITTMLETWGLVLTLLAIYLGAVSKGQKTKN